MLPFWKGAISPVKKCYPPIENLQVITCDTCVMTFRVK